MRQTTWSNIGKPVNGANIDEILKESGLDYNVVKSAITTNIGGHEILYPDRVLTVREDTHEVFGCVSPKYEICQNQEAFAFVDNVDNVNIIKAGQTHTGLVYLIGQLPEVTVLNDTFTPYLIFQNSHNGNYTLKTTICPLRIVCQNQFNISFKESKNTISIQHSRQYAQRLAEAEKLIKETAHYMTTFKNTAEDLAMLKVGNDANVKSIIDSFFTIATDASDKQVEHVIKQREDMFSCYKADDNSNFTGTVWGLHNAFADYITHKNTKNTKTKDEGQFMSVTLDPRLFAMFANHVQKFV